MLGNISIACQSLHIAAIKKKKSHLSSQEELIHSFTLSAALNVFLPQETSTSVCVCERERDLEDDGLTL